MSGRRAWSRYLLVLGFGLSAAPAMAGIIFTDLASPPNVYSCCAGWTVSGDGGLVPISHTSANGFTAAMSGNVTQIDLAVTKVLAPATFYASIWTDVAGLPGAQVPGARWDDLLVSETFGACCGLVSITGISGVSLAAGQPYFMIVGPMSTHDTSWNVWNYVWDWDSSGAVGPFSYSTDGGASWYAPSSAPLGAFDILGQPVPEPTVLLMVASGVAGLAGRRLRRS